MILSVHAIFGAAVASLIPTHPVLGFSLGFASHFAIDAIPHRDYDLVSIESDTNKKFRQIDLTRKYKLLRDIIFVSFDAVTGFYLSFLFFFNPVYPWIFFIGAFSALLPDFFTFLYLIFKHKTLHSFFNFHSEIIHSKMILKLNQFTGILVQFCTLALLIVIMFGVKWLIS